jgi:hypothetical protein
MKTSTIDALSDAELSLIAERCRTEAATARINGHGLSPAFDLAAKFADHIVILRRQISGKK